MKDLRGKVAVVTGAASGIGLSLVEKFAAQQMKVVLADLDAQGLAAANESLQARAVETLTVQVDVSKLEDVQRLAKSALERFGAVHIVCNNAGVFSRPGYTWEQSQASWDRCLNVNLWGVINGIRAFVPILLEQKTEAHIVNVASLAGHVIEPNFSPYHASKFGVTAITESLFHELQSLKANIGVSLASPGFVRTNLLGDGSGFGDADRISDDDKHAELRQRFKAGFENGLDAAEVAKQINNAILQNRFYVFTHSISQELLRSRVDPLLSGEDPQLFTSYSTDQSLDQAIPQVM